jgi:hypothetical protein
MSVARLWRDSATCAGGNFAVITWFGIFASTFLSSSPTCPATQSVGIAVVSAGRRKPRCRRATIAEAVCPQHRRSQPEATKLMAAATTQSVAITCAQIATIPKNSASEASVATSSTRVRPMSLTPILNAPFLADPWERLSFHSSRWQWKGSIARRTLGLSLTP